MGNRRGSEQGGGKIGNFKQNNYIYELGVVERIGICQEDAIILKEALAPSFIN